MRNGNWAIISTMLLIASEAAAGGLFPSRIFEVGDRPVSVAVADLDGDSFADVVTANYQSGDVSVLLGNGDGSFQAAVSLATGEATSSIAVADFDGDSVPDLVTASDYSGAVSVLLGNGDGSFQAALPFAVPNGPSSVAVGDFDTDGVPDIVTADGSEVSVLLGNGDGSFQAAVSFAAGDGAITVAVADLDGDSIPDLVTPNADDGGVSVLLGSGDGSFQAPIFFAAGDFPVSVAVADLDGDGVPDIATANSNLYWPSSGDVSVLLGNGDGSFQAAVSFAAGDTPVSVAVADLDGDSVPDLVTANEYSGDVSVLLGNGDGSFQAAASFAAGSAPVSVAVADLDGDSVPDLVTANEWSNGVIVLLGNGDGSFPAAMAFAAGDNPGQVAVADLDGDSVPDLVTANPYLFSPGSGYVSVLLGNGDGSFQAAVAVAAGDAPFSVAVADLDGDNFPDIVTANRYLFSPGSGDVSVLMGNGDGSFQTAVSVAGDGPAFVTVADLDGDSVPDLVTLNYDGGDGSVLLGNGDGSFQAAVSFAEGDTPSSVAVADLDGDSVPDLVTANPFSDAVSVLLGNGDGSFQAGVSFAAGAFAFLVAVADLDGDSVPDLVTANGDVVGVSVLLGNGDGSFQAAVPIPEGGSPQFVAVADLDGDSVPDLVTADPRQSPARQDSMPSGRRLIDRVLLAASWLAACILVAPLVFEAIMDSRARRAERKLQRLSESLQGYAESHRVYPTPPESGPMSRAGLYAPMLVSEHRLVADDGTVLVPDSKLAEQGNFRIPTLDEVQAAMGTAEFDALVRRMGGDFGYTLGHRDAEGRLLPNRDRRRGHHPLLADAPDESGERSDNHPDGAHYILFEDGHFERRRLDELHPENDHLYRNHEGEIAAGVDPEDDVIGDSHHQP